MIYGITTTFPNSEKYGLANQMNSSVVSVSSNIAEGSGKIQSKDKARFIHIAYGSLMELLNQLIIASDFGWLAPEQYLLIRSQICFNGCLIFTMGCYENGRGRKNSFKCSFIINQHTAG